MEKKTFIFLLFVFAIIISANSLISLSTRPSFCGLCHEKDFRGWVKSSHRTTRCNFCHQKPGILGFTAQRFRVVGMVGAYATGLYSRPVTTTVSNDVCLSCHERIKKGTKSRNALRVSHREIVNAGYECGYCHSTVPHASAVPSPETTTMGKCSECHNGQIADFECTKCHLENVKRRRLSRDDPWRITHGKNWRRLHGMGELKTCNICHSRSSCVRCHQVELPHPEGFMNLHGKSAKSSSEPCYSCHDENLCNSCHRTPMPHPTGFLARHSQIVKTEGETNCMGCHMEAGCSACHEQHIHRAVFWFEGRPRR